MANFIISFKNSYVYRSNLLFGLISPFIKIFSQIALWSFLYQGNSSMITYMSGYVVLSSAIHVFYSGEIYYLISEKVSKGDYILELLRPCSFLLQKYQSALGVDCSRFLVKAMPILLIFSPVLYRSCSLSYLPAALLAIILAHFLFTILYALVGCISFVFVEPWAFRRVLEDTVRILSGSIIPLALFPDWAQSIMRFLPFQYLYDLPIRLFLGQITDQSEIIWQLFLSAAWVFTMSLLLLVVYRLAQRHCVTQGG